MADPISALLEIDEGLRWGYIYIGARGVVPDNANATEKSKFTARSTKKSE
jgi:hypothetical protein